MQVYYTAESPMAIMMAIAAIKQRFGLLVENDGSVEMKGGMTYCFNVVPHPAIHDEMLDALVADPDTLNRWDIEYVHYSVRLSYTPEKQDSLSAFVDTFDGLMLYFENHIEQQGTCIFNYFPKKGKLVGRGHVMIDQAIVEDLKHDHCPYPAKLFLLLRDYVEYLRSNELDVLVNASECSNMYQALEVLSTHLHWALPIRIEEAIYRNIMEHCQTNKSVDIPNIYYYGKAISLEEINLFQAGYSRWKDAFTQLKASFVALHSEVFPDHLPDPAPFHTMEPKISLGFPNCLGGVFTIDVTQRDYWQTIAFIYALGYRPSEIKHLFTKTKPGDPSKLTLKLLADTVNEEEVAPREMKFKDLVLLGMQYK